MKPDYSNLRIVQNGRNNKYTLVSVGRSSFPVTYSTSVTWLKDWKYAIGMFIVTEFDNQEHLSSWLNATNCNLRKDINVTQYIEAHPELLI
jgi:GH43 family beta-xylosidase